MAAERPDISNVPLLPLFNCCLTKAGFLCSFPLYADPGSSVAKTLCPTPRMPCARAWRMPCEPTGSPSPSAQAGGPSVLSHGAGSEPRGLRIPCCPSCSLLSPCSPPTPLSQEQMHVKWVGFGAFRPFGSAPRAVDAE